MRLYYLHQIGGAFFDAGIVNKEEELFQRGKSRGNPAECNCWKRNTVFS